MKTDFAAVGFMGAGLVLALSIFGALIQACIEWWIV